MGVLLRFTGPGLPPRDEAEPAEAGAVAGSWTTLEGVDLLASQLVRDHATALLRVAVVITGDTDLAVAAVVGVFVAAVGNESHPDADLTRAELSRLTVWSCARTMMTAGPQARSASARAAQADDTRLRAALRSIPVRERALLALTTHGDHSYREAADALSLPPEIAVGLPRSALQTVSDDRPATPRRLRGEGRPLGSRTRHLGVVD